MRTYKLTILSSFTHKTWTGDYMTGAATTADLLADVWRYFNVVERGDRERLLRHGYDLPSLSAGDVVCIDTDEADERPRMFIVQGIGWREVWPGMGLAPEGATV